MTTIKVDQEKVLGLLREHRPFFVYPPGCTDCTCGWQQERSGSLGAEQHHRHVAALIIDTYAIQDSCSKTRRTQ